MVAKDNCRCPPLILVHEIFLAASHRRMVRLHMPNIEAAIPILTHDVIIPYPVKYHPLNHDIIHAVSNFVQEKVNCLATLIHQVD